jgi:hypothetical protein
MPLYNGGFREHAHRPPGLTFDALGSVSSSGVQSEEIKIMTSSLRTLIFLMHLSAVESTHLVVIIQEFLHDEVVEIII